MLISFVTRTCLYCVRPEHAYVFRVQDMDDLMLSSRRLKDAGGDPETVPWDVACAWLSTQRDRWLPWIPASCAPGHYVDTSFAACLPCTRGAYCLGQYAAPAACPPGTYCPSNATSPVPCPDGRSTAASGAAAESDCAVCPGGVWIGGRCVPDRVLLPAILLPGALALALAVVCWRRLRVVTSRRLLEAAVGTEARQGDLPYELRRKYEAVRVVGRGAFGVVIEAWQLTNGRRNVPRAVKLMYSERAALTDKEVRRMDREVRRTAIVIFERERERERERARGREGGREGGRERGGERFSLS